MGGGGCIGERECVGKEEYSYPTRVGNVEGKSERHRKGGRTNKDETRSKDEKRARMLIGLKLNPTHLSLPVWSVRPSPSSPLVPRIAGIADKNRGRGAAPPVPIYRQKIRWPRRVVTGREPQIRFVERRAEFLVGRGHSHRVQGVVRGSKSYWSWCTPWQMDELFSAASRVLREM